MSSVWIGLGIAAGSAVYGGVQSNKANKANKANQQAYNKGVIKSEKEARKLFDGFIGDYNSSKEKLEEGITLQEYIGNMITALGDPELEKQFRAAKNADWEQAQRFADEATDQNISAFNRVVDNVSGGDYQKFIKKRNEIVMSEDVDSLYKEARRLKAPKQMAGSVRRDPETGEVIGGQRGDKFEFDVSTTAIKEANDRQFAKLNTTIESDRTAAERQKERAIQFLPMLDYAGFTSSQVVQPYQTAKVSTQLAMLQADANMAANAMSMAFGKPLAPAQIDTSKYDAMAAAGTQQAIGSLAELYKNQRSTTTTASDGVEVRKAIPMNQTTGAGTTY